MKTEQDIREMIEELKSEASKKNELLCSERYYIKALSWVLDEFEE